jgi:hypothetical protein
VILVVVPLLVFIVPVSMFVVLMAIVLKVGACHPRWCNQGCAQQK